MAEFRPAQVGDKIKLTGKGLGPGVTKAGDTVVVTKITPGVSSAQDMISWVGGEELRGVFNVEGRFELVEAAEEILTPDGALTAQDDHWYL